MENIPQRKVLGEEEQKKRLKIRSDKEFRLRLFTPQCREISERIINKVIIQNIHFLNFLMKNRLTNLKRFTTPLVYYEPDPPLLKLSRDLDVLSVNQEIGCPKCNIGVKCIGLSKHLAVCMYPQQSNFSYSSRNSSRIARQRIQEGFKTSYDDSKNESDDEKKPKKRICKSKKKQVISKIN